MPKDAIATAEDIRSGRRSAREVVEESIARIEARDPELNVMVAPRFDEALAEVDAGLPDGPLTGVPIVVKDLGADVAGLPTTRGSRLWADDVKAADSELVRRYRAAGMVVLGKTNTPELGKNASTEPLLFGPTRNPWDPTRSPGGSSGGSAAAVSSGMVPVGHANDGGGSIRIPAAACGLFGLKPSRGRVSSAPYASALAGPVTVQHAVTTTVRDSALLLDLTAGTVPGDAYGAADPPTSYLAACERDPAPLRVGVATALPGVDTDPQCVEAVLGAARLLADLGHTVVEVEPGWDPGDVGATSGLLMGAELVVAVRERLARLGRDLRDNDLEPFTRVMVDHYATLPMADLSGALRRAQEIGWEVGAAFHDVDVLLVPTLARPTPPLGTLDTTRPEVMYEIAAIYSAWTAVANLTGLPAASVPWGLDEGGVPLGVQLVADMGAEHTLVALSGQLERVAPWQRLAPA
ncbi:MAG: amidase [Nocardioides sp.]|nr:amidase [Nocardioides sp.]